MEKGGGGIGGKEEFGWNHVSGTAARDAFHDFRMFPRKFSPRFLDSTRSRSFVHIAAPPFVRPLGRGWRICTRPLIRALPVSSKLPLYLLFRSQDFHNFFQSNPILSSPFPILSIRRLTYSVNWLHDPSVVIYRTEDGMKMFWIRKEMERRERKGENSGERRNFFVPEFSQILFLIDLKTIATCS